MVRVSLVSDGGQLKSFFDNLMRKQAREAGADRTMEFLDSFGQPSVGQNRMTPQAFAMLSPEQQNQMIRSLRSEGVNLGPYMSAAGVEGTDILDAANIAFNLPFDALSAVANLTNIERGREEGFAANVEGARGAFSESLNPDRFAPVQYAEEIGYPFPEALGTALDVAMPGPGEFKPLLSLLAPRNITKVSGSGRQPLPAEYLERVRNWIGRTGTPKGRFYQLSNEPMSAEIYAESMNLLPEEMRKFVTLLSPEEIQQGMKDGNRYYMTDQGAGFAIGADGEFMGVFNAGPERRMAPEMVKQSIEEGATHLFAFDADKSASVVNLPELYGSVIHNGKQYQITERMPWNDEYAPENWNYDLYGRPEYVRMDLVEVGQ